MRLSRLVIKNFRNLVDVDISMRDGAVIVGENSAGKSNMLHALRLVLDPHLSSYDRRLSAADFSDYLGSDPMGTGATVTIAVEVEEFEDDEGLLATLHSSLIAGDPMRARLTFLYRPRAAESSAEGRPYEWIIFGGQDDQNVVGGELRSFLHHTHMHALRDVESDLASWRRSPLRPIIDEIATSVPADAMETVEDALAAANDAIRDLSQVQDAAVRIKAQTELLVGSIHALEPSLDLTPVDPTRTLRNLRLFLDGAAQRDLNSASLGSLNVLYIALLRLDLARQIKSGEIEHALTTIEEPEAHLHPHLQRRMFAGLLSQTSPKISTIVTTHSPHIVSVTPPQSLVLLRPDTGGTRAYSASAADLSEVEWNDLQRYLDATRSEMVFAKRVMLVEGFAEQVLVPLLAGGPRRLDEEGITVCSVHGTHFASYIRFLRAIGTPYAVITDGDPTAGPGKTGPERVARLARLSGVEASQAEEVGLFMGTVTLEADLFDTSAANASAMAAAAASFATTTTKSSENESKLLNGDGTAFVKGMGVSKGRFAQRLASRAPSLDTPPYIERALHWLNK
ncbi:ATP-dependent nuclease [Modestobacter sp. SYSU DS0290]